ncbi:MAG: hypothetical protein R3B72_01355 [Polyangiaceae bacterium]
MTIRTAHGNGKGALVRVETPPADELQPGPGPDLSGPIPRGPDGRFTADGARLAGRLGGKRSAKRRKLASALADQLGLEQVPPSLAPYIDAATDFASAHLASLASQFGEVGPGPSSMVQSAALALAASRAAYASGDAKTGAMLSDKARQALLTAHHVCELEAKARSGDGFDLDAITARIDRLAKEGRK